MLQLSDIEQELASSLGQHEVEVEGDVGVHGRLDGLDQLLVGGA